MCVLCVCDQSSVCVRSWGLTLATLSLNRKHFQKIIHFSRPGLRERDWVRRHSAGLIQPQRNQNQAVRENFLSHVCIYSKSPNLLLYTIRTYCKLHWRPILGQLYDYFLLLLKRSLSISLHPPIISPRSLSLYLSFSPPISDFRFPVTFQIPDQADL